MVSFDLPLPPSTNNLFFNRRQGGRAKTSRYEKWIHDARILLMAQRARPIDGPVNISLEVTEKSRCDLENHCKSVVDLLVAHKVIADDNKKIVRGIVLSWSDAIDGVRVTIQSA